MQKELCHYLKNRLEVLPFIDVLAGVAQTVSITDTTGDGTPESVTTTTTKRVPVSDDTNQDPAIFGFETILIPNEGRRSIIYFEDYGISEIDYNGRAGFESSVRVVVWLNRDLLTGNRYSVISGRVMAAVIKALKTNNPVNVDIFTRLSVSIANIPPQDPALFGRYTYDETQRQYLRPPFEFFAIDLTAKYLINSNCLSSINFL